MKGPRLPTHVPAPSVDDALGGDAHRTFRVHLGAALQKHRLRRGWTQGQLAEAAGVSLKYVGEIERGDANATLETLEVLAAMIGWDPMDALDGAREPITEGVRQMLIQEKTDDILRAQQTMKWLSALDPWKQVDSPRSKTRPPRRVRSKARPSVPRQPDRTPATATHPEQHERKPASAGVSASPGASRSSPPTPAGVHAPVTKRKEPVR